MADKCLGVKVCRAGTQCVACRETLAAMRPIGTAAIPVRRFGTPPVPDDDLAYEVMRDEFTARTIAEHGAAAIWMAALSAACIGALVLYVA